MSREQIDSQRVIATSVACLSFMLMLFVLVSGGTRSLSPGSVPDSLALAEFQHLVPASHAEKNLVERPSRASMVASANGDDAPDRLPAASLQFDADGSGGVLFVLPICSGPGLCTGYVRPLLRAPPLV